jgi:hypothetical protein
MEVNAASWDHEGCRGWTEKTCGEYSYWGGVNECALDATLSKTLPSENLGEAGVVDISFRLWTIDSWDNEMAYVKVKDQDGNVLAEHEQQALHGHNGADKKFDKNSCRNFFNHEGWDAGYYEIAL